jgi:biotin-(acetyl-CoA carboxylase) ligase
MLNLKTRVKLKEEEIISVGIVEVLDGSGTLVTNVLSQTLSGSLHLSERFGLGNDGRSLLENLLESTLSGAITAVQSDGISVLVTNNLNLKMAGILTELHDKDGRSHNLVLNLDVGILQIFFVVDETDTFSASSL